MCSSPGVATATQRIRTQTASLARILDGWSDEDFRLPVDMFGRKVSRGSLVISLVVSGHAAYRTQLFLYLKANGREELSTVNLWAGIDAMSKA
jgi:hypothetical protein